MNDVNNKNKATWIGKIRSLHIGKIEQSHAVFYGVVIAIALGMAINYIQSPSEKEIQESEAKLAIERQKSDIEEQKLRAAEIAREKEEAQEKINKLNEMLADQGLSCSVYLEWVNAFNKDFPANSMRNPILSARVISTSKNINFLYRASHIDPASIEYMKELGTEYNNYLDYAKHCIDEYTKGKNIHPVNIADTVLEELESRQRLGR